MFDSASLMEFWFVNLKMLSIAQSSNVVALDCRILHLNSLKHGHSFRMCGKVSSSSSQNLQIAEIFLTLLCT